MRTASLIVLFLLVALVSAVLTMRFAIHGAEAPVPDLRGMTEPAATGKAGTLDLTLKVDDRFYSQEIPAGYVLTQSPVAGTIVRRGTEVRVSESLGPQQGAVPDLIGKPERLAFADVRRIGLTLGDIARMPFAAQPPGVVIAQTPGPDAAKVERPEVDVLLSEQPPAESKAFVMPDFRKQNEHAVTVAVVHAGLKLGPLQYQYVTIPPVGSQPGQVPVLPVAPGTVLAQAPQPGQRVTPDMVIQLTIAR